MTTNGKILFCTAFLLLVLGFCISPFGGDGSFREVWIALLSLGALLGAAILGAMALVDTLLENEE